MDLLISLCHFCEIHGPSVVLNSLSFNGNQAYDIEGLRDRLIRANLNQSDPNLCTTHEIEDKETFLFDDDSTRKSAACEGCSFHTNTGKYDFMTFDEALNVCYITEGFPDRSIFFEGPFNACDIKVNCMRSLSCELYPKNCGMLYFTDDNNAHVISFLFSLQDSKARGFQRKYSIVVMAKESRYLFSNWNMLIKNITLVISLLQRKAKSIFKSELKPEACLNKRSIILDKVANDGSLNYFEEIFDHDSSDTSKNKIKARSLFEITGDNNVFYYLHMQFSSIIGELTKRARSIKLKHNFFDLSSATFFGNDNSTLRTLYSLAGNDFMLIASNVVLGNRVIVFGSNSMNRTKMLVSILAKLLPNESIHILPDSNIESLNFRESNILGACANIFRLDMLKTIHEFYICLEICDQSTNDKENNNESLQNCCIKVHCCDEILAQPPPSYIIQLELLLKDLSISDATINARIDSLKFEWLNKSKAMQSFVKEFPDFNDKKLQTILNALKMNSDDLRLVQYWSKSFLPNKSDNV